LLQAIADKQYPYDGIPDITIADKILQGENFLWTSNWFVHTPDSEDLAWVAESRTASCIGAIGV
jgi:hypothetical protein